MVQLKFFEKVPYFHFSRSLFCQPPGPAPSRTGAMQWVSNPPIFTAPKLVFSPHASHLYSTVCIPSLTSFKRTIVCLHERATFNSRSKSRSGRALARLPGALLQSARETLLYPSPTLPACCGASPLLHFDSFGGKQPSVLVDIFFFSSSNSFSFFTITAGCMSVFILVVATNGPRQHYNPKVFIAYPFWTLN